MFDSYETFNDFSSSPSTISFEFLHLLDPDEPQLLSRSISLEDLLTTSDDDSCDVPPFPLDRRTFPITPIFLDNYPPLFTGRTTAARDDHATATLTIPTTPRMATMLKEPLVIHKWVVCHVFLCLGDGTLTAITEGSDDEFRVSRTSPLARH